MEAAFADLAKQGKTDVDSLVKWMKESKIIEQAEEDKVRRLLNDVPDKKNVAVDKFRDVVREVSNDSKMDLDNTMKRLAETGLVRSGGSSAVQSVKETVTRVVKGFLPKK